MEKETILNIVPTEIFIVSATVDHLNDKFKHLKTIDYTIASVMEFFLYGTKPKLYEGALVLRFASFHCIKFTI